MTIISWAEAISSLEAIGKPVSFIITTLLFTLVYYACQATTSDAPLLNPKQPFELSSKRTKGDFVSKAHRLVGDWFKSNPEKPMRLIGDVGDITVLPPSLAQEIRNDKRLDFAAWIYKAFHGDLPGFDGFRESATGSNLVQTVVTKDITKLLSKITEPLSEETTLSLQEIFTDKADWHTVSMRESILRIVARISSRVFLGTELCRDEAWLRITREYTVTGFIAAEELRMWPQFTRPLVHWFLPGCRKLRAQVNEARQIIDSTVHRRRKLKQELLAEGKDAPKYYDAIEWCEQSSKGATYGPTGAQLSLSLAAIHTTTDLLCQVLTRLGENQEILQPLRNEMTLILREEGWSKASLYKMKLLDSVIKESQRMKPTEIVSMARLALEDVKLSDDTIIPKDTGVAVSAHRMWDAGTHTNPDEWDGYRFYKMREDPGKQNVSQLVATSPDHLAFGHGMHACPGRFFAANEVKIALVHIIMKYDWELVEGGAPRVLRHGFTLTGDPSMEMKIRRRKEEMEI